MNNMQPVKFQFDEGEPIYNGFQTGEESINGLDRVFVTKAVYEQFMKDMVENWGECEEELVESMMESEVGDGLYHLDLYQYEIVGTVGFKRERD